MITREETVEIVEQHYGEWERFVAAFGDHEGYDAAAVVRFLLDAVNASPEDK